MLQARGSVVKLFYKFHKILNIKNEGKAGDSGSGLGALTHLNDPFLFEIIPKVLQWKLIAEQQGTSSKGLKRKDEGKKSSIELVSFYP